MSRVESEGCRSTEALDPSECPAVRALSASGLAECGRPLQGNGYHERIGIVASRTLPAKDLRDAQRPVLLTAFILLAPSESADEKMVSQKFAVGISLTGDCVRLRRCGALREPT